MTDYPTKTGYPRAKVEIRTLGQALPAEAFGHAARLAQAEFHTLTNGADCDYVIVAVPVGRANEEVRS